MSYPRWVAPLLGVGRSSLMARFLGGLGIGGSSVLGPVYIAELAPPKSRGRLVGSFINIAEGILLAYFSNFVIASFHLGAQEWRWEFGVAAIPALLFLLMLFGISHSPRWLVTKGRTQEALKTLIAIGTPDPEAELQAIQGSVYQDTNVREERLFQRRYLVPMLLAVSIAAFNQLSGINAVLYYVNDIFVAAGFSRLAGGMQAVVVGAVNLLFTLVAMTLIDKLGRKTLLVIGSAGMTIALSGIATIFITRRWHAALIFFVAGFIASFATSSGAVIWVYMSEIFPTSVRVKGQALGSTVLWVMNGLISQIFPLLSAKSASLPFVCFAVVMALQFVVTLLYFPGNERSLAGGSAAEVAFERDLGEIGSSLSLSLSGLCRRPDGRQLGQLDLAQWNSKRGACYDVQLGWRPYDVDGAMYMFHRGDGIQGPRPERKTPSHRNFPAAAFLVPAVRRCSNWPHLL